MNDDILVRPYEPRDRPAVRALACDTADRGEPIERFFRDREMAADLLTRYYTDCEPHATWIAESDGRLVGYLTGCLDSRRSRRVMTWRVVPAAVGKAFARGTLFAPQTWRVLIAGLTTWLRGGFRREVSPAAYPAHLHLNVRQGFRGHHVGRRLIASFLHQATARGLAGVHALIRSDNPAACRFFDRLGFTAVSRHPAVVLDGRDRPAGEVVLYGKAL